MSTRVENRAPDRPVLCLGVTYSVCGRPMKLSVEPLGNSRHRVSLVRTDWQSLNCFQRFIATILSVFRLDAPERADATTQEAAAVQNLMERIAKEDDHDKANVIREQRTAQRYCEQLHKSPSDPVSLREAYAASILGLENRIVLQFEHRFRDVLPALRQLYIDQPLSIAEKACETMLMPILQEVGRQITACEPQGLSSASRASICEKLGVGAKVRVWRMIARTVADPLERRARIEAAEQARSANRELKLVDLPFDMSGRTIPAEQPGLPEKCEILFGDMHGNCQMMLHTLVKLGFMRVRNALAWKAANEMLALVDTPESDHSYRDFREMLKIALEPNPNGRDRKLVLLGDLLSDRVHHDMFMLAIFERMDAAKVNFDIIFSNHDSEFIAYFLNNRGKADSEPYVTRDIGIGISRDVAKTLYRLHDLMNVGLSSDPGAPHVEHPDTAAQRRHARFDLREWTEQNYFQHLKLLSCSDDASSFYSHGFVNGSIVAAIGKMSGADPALPLPARLHHINSWFRTNILTEPSRYRLLTHEGSWELEDNKRLRRAYLVSPVRLAAWNIAHDAEKFPDGIDHPYASAVELPGETIRHAIHGHTLNVGERLRRQIIGTAAPLASLESLRAPDISEQYRQNLNALLRGLTPATDRKVCSVAASAVRFVLQSLQGEGQHQDPEVTALIRTVRETGTDVSAACQALVAFWNVHCVREDNGEAPLETWPAAVARELADPAAWPVDAAASEAAATDSVARVLPALTAKVAAFDRAAEAHISPEDKLVLAHGQDARAAIREAYLRGVETRYISLDGAAGQERPVDDEGNPIPANAFFVRRVHIV